ncbi:MAG: SDR family NAD(P)-dependent oxidoreductase, partial [Planctomycetota bacterium]
MTQTWLVTGATGFLGAHVAEAAAAAGHRVLLAGRDPGRRIDRLGPEAPFVPLDLSEPESVRAVSERAQGLSGPVDVVINAAALARAGQCHAHPGMAMQVNGLAPSQLRGAFGPEVRFLQISTDLVWGRCACPPSGFAEDTPLEHKPADVYALTKLLGEQRIDGSEGTGGSGGTGGQPLPLTVRLALLYGDSRG